MKQYSENGFTASDKNVKGPRWQAPKKEKCVELDGDSLSLRQVHAVAMGTSRVALSNQREVQHTIHASQQHIAKKVLAGEPIYGVTTGFGGMANVAVNASRAAELQANLLRFTMVGAGDYLPREDVRAAMVARANSHMRGVSGIRLEVIQRIVAFLNADAVPLVRQFGSIGASGDLAPLSQIMGAVCGLSPYYQVDYKGSRRDCLSVLEDLNLRPMPPLAKEGLAMINGTSMMTGTSVLALRQSMQLIDLALHLHAFYIQALGGTNESFHPFVHEHKAHTGQLQAANVMMKLLDQSKLSRDEFGNSHSMRDNELIQDRYSLRCLPQFLGPVIDGINETVNHVEQEINSANDNPLIDPDNGACYHSGNFLGQYIAVGMDRVRQLIGLTAKHLDTQIALLMAPEFSNNLPASLVGNTKNTSNMGLKGLQISGNSMMPLLTWYGQSIADRFPTHAEQYNQNINSQGFASANLAREQLTIARQYWAVAAISAIQAVDLRTNRKLNHYDAREALSPACVPLYEALRTVVDVPVRAARPYVVDDADQFLDRHIELVADDLASPDSRIFRAIKQTAIWPW
jgi:phenylalanine ammonia-lyase